jgi:predicted ester cyclase
MNRRKFVPYAPILLLAVLLLAACQPVVAQPPAQTDSASRATGMTTAEANKAFVLRYFDAISGKPKPAEVVDEYIADSDQALKEHIAAAEAAFPLYRLDLEEIYAEGDTVIVRYTLRATHEGDFMGIPPTGAEVEVPGVIIYHIADGKIADHWMLTDRMTMMQQLGVLPAAQ